MPRCWLLQDALDAIEMVNLGVYGYSTAHHENAMEAFRKTNLPFPAMRFFHEHSQLYYLLNKYV